LATPLIVCDPADRRLEPFLSVRERDLVGRGGRFIAEGDVVLKILLESDRFDIETILVSSRVAAAGRDWFSRIPGTVSFMAADDDVIARASGFHVHRGILAVGRRRMQPDAAAVLSGLPERALAVVCVGIANHDNMGGIFRNAAAFGVDAVLCDSTSCDPLYRKAIRVSVGGVFRTPFATGASAFGLVDALEAEGFRCFALSPSGRDVLDALRPPPRTALVLGAEGPGLPPDLLARLSTVRIDMAAGFDSLNVAVAAGIALHHAAKR
jgi:tRNA G18 (ribose-2'-O)-methylase SpoU